MKTINTNPYFFDIIMGAHTERLPIVVRKHPRSRSMVIRYQPLQHALSLTLPRYVGIRQGLHFVEEKRNWIEKQIREHIKRIPLADGQVIPVLGRDYHLKHIGGRGVIRIEGDEILVPGDMSFMKRRVREWLKEIAKDEITRLAQEKVQFIGKKIKKISMRDTSSRWGSCSHDGSLSFSWRLVFAPYEVLEYLVSHEVAHIAEHNHSIKFWAVVGKLYPDYKRSQAWLKAYGQTLYAYG